MKDLLFFFKCKAGLLDIQLSDYVQNQLAPKYNFRSYDVNNFRSEYFKNSYFPRVVRISKWNSLDSDIKTIDSFDIFKSKLYQKFYSELNSYESHTNGSYLLYCSLVYVLIIYFYIIYFYI
jgi:hypothetical protein